MNPYAFPNLVQPSVPVDYRSAHTNPTSGESGYDMSRAIFRMVCVVENLLRRSG